MSYCCDYCAEEATNLGHRDEESARSFELDPAGTNAAASPVTDGAGWSLDEVAELLEREQVCVIPFLGDVDGLHAHDRAGGSRLASVGSRGAVIVRPVVRTARRVILGSHGSPF